MRSPEGKRNQQQKITSIGAAVASTHRCVAENATVPVERPSGNAQIAAVSTPSVRTKITITTTKIPRIQNRQHNLVPRRSRASAETRMIKRRTIQEFKEFKNHPKNNQKSIFEVKGSEHRLLGRRVSTTRLWYHRPPVRKFSSR